MQFLQRERDAQVRRYYGHRKYNHRQAATPITFVDGSIASWLMKIANVLAIILSSNHYQTFCHLLVKSLLTFDKVPNVVVPSSKECLKKFSIVVV